MRACCSSTSTICSTCRKLEAGKLKIELQSTDVAALVRFMASHFDVLAAERGMRSAVETPPSLVAAVDPDKLQRVRDEPAVQRLQVRPAGRDAFAAGCAVANDDWSCASTIPVPA